jgi:agmatinase
MTPLEELALLLKPAGGGLYLVSTGKAEQQALQRRFYGASSDADITQKFLADLARIERAKVVLLGIPSDVGAGFRRGANLGPQAIRTRLLDDDPNFAAYCAEHDVLDIGDVFVVPQLLHDEMLSERQLQRSRDALYSDLAPAQRGVLPVSPLSIAERALALVLQINPRVKPLMLGGDHSTAWPVVKALHDAGERFGILHLDAHTDLLRERLGVEYCFATWSYHANDLIGRAGRLIQVGIRATRYPREHWESQLDVRQFWPEEQPDDEQLLRDVLAAVRATGLPMYLSNDIDGTDAEDADATGTPESGGLRVSFVRELISQLPNHTRLVGADLVEVAPLLGRDAGSRTLEVAAQYVRVTLDGLLRSFDS